MSLLQHTHPTTSRGDHDRLVLSQILPAQLVLLLVGLPRHLHPNASPKPQNYRKLNHSRFCDLLPSYRHPFSGRIYHKRHNQTPRSNPLILLSNVPEHQECERDHRKYGNVSNPVPCYDLA